MCIRDRDGSVRDPLAAQLGVDELLEWLGGGAGIATGLGHSCQLAHVIALGQHRLGKAVEFVDTHPSSTGHILHRFPCANAGLDLPCLLYTSRCV